MAIPIITPADSEEEIGFDDDDIGFVLDHETDIPPRLRGVFNAVHSGDVDALRFALDNWNGSIDVPVEDGDTALHLACLYGHLACVQLLLEMGACLEAKDDDGAIPLHDACAGGYTEIVQLLINSANNPEVIKRMLESVDVEGDTPLHHATRGGHEDVTRLLLAAGASPTKKNSNGKAPYELADPGTEAKRIAEEAANGADN